MIDGCQEVTEKQTKGGRHNLTLQVCVVFYQVLTGARIVQLALIKSLDKLYEHRAFKAAVCVCKSAYVCACLLVMSLIIPWLQRLILLFYRGHACTHTHTTLEAHWNGNRHYSKAHCIYHQNTNSAASSAHEYH